MNWKKTTWILGLAGAVIFAAAGLWLRSRNASAVEYFTAPAGLGSIRTVVNATGVVQTVVTVQVGSQISGEIKELYADFNSVVKRGQLLAKIDPRNFEAQLENATAAVAGARARVGSAKAELVTAEASERSAKANLDAALVARDNTATLFRRAVDLTDKGIASKNDYDEAKANADSAQARYEQALAGVDQSGAQKQVAAAQVDSAIAQLDQAQADLDRAKVNLEYTNIYSPVEGVVISRSVDVGQTIAASLQSPTLFTIANDLRKMKVNASIDEADIGNISDQADARFTVDAYPNETFKGQIEEIRLSPTTVQNVVTYSVILSIDNSDLKLKPGMTANITIAVDQRDTVLKIPNAALRYTPAGTQGIQKEQVRTSTAELLKDEEEGTREVQASASKRSEQGTVNLAPGQKWDPAAKLRLVPQQRRVLRAGRVWVLGAEGKPEPANLVLGITDGTATEVISGQLKAGAEVIIGDTSQAAATSGQSRSVNPFLPTPRVPGMRGGR
jgi:HlyD family secretion protein